MTSTKKNTEPYAPGTLEELQELMTRSPFHQWLGLKPESVTPNGIVIGVTLRPEMTGSSRLRTLHGGVFAAIIDTTASFAILTRHPGTNLTNDMRVDYHRSLVMNETGETRIRAVGSIVRAGRTVATGDAQVLDLEGNLLASGRAVYMRNSTAHRATAQVRMGGDVG